MPCGRIFEDNQARRPGGTLTHGAQAVQALAGQRVLVEDLAGQAGVFRQRCGALGQKRRGKEIARHVGEVARKAHGPGRAFATARGGMAPVGHAFAVKAEGQPFRGGRLFGGGLFQRVKAVERQLGRAHAFLHQTFAAARQTRELRFGQEEGAHAQGAATLDAGGHGRTHAVGRDLVPLAKADGEHARDVQLRVPVQQGERPLPGLEITQGRRHGEPGGGLVQLRILEQELLAFAGEGQHDVALPVLRAEILKTHFHGMLSLGAVRRAGR